ncbi:MAG TPA: hypothetical protein V6C76_15655 [Drouetiella sp.]
MHPLESAAKVLLPGMFQFGFMMAAGSWIFLMLFVVCICLIFRLEFAENYRAVQAFLSKHGFGTTWKSGAVGALLMVLLGILCALMYAQPRYRHIDWENGKQSARLNTRYSTAPIPPPPPHLPSPHRAPFKFPNPSATPVRPAMPPQTVPTMSRAPFSSPTHESSLQFARRD